MSRKRSSSYLPNKKLGALIRQHRQELKLSLRDFAKDAQVDHTLVMRLEEGHDVMLSHFLKLARAHSFPFSL